MNCQSPADFLIKLVLQISNLQGEYYVLGLSFRNPWFTEVIYVFRNREAAKILIHFLFLLNLGFSSRASVGCCLFDLDAIKPWINISLMDQTKLFQLKTALLWESAYGCMTTRRLIIQWSQKILIIDIIISWKLLWDQRPQTIRILHEWNTETPHFQSKRVLVPELLTCSREDRLPNRLIQITRIDQTLPILIQSRPFLLTWININSSMDK